MAGESTTTSSSLAGSVAIVTGSNKGIGFEICKQLAAQGIIAVLTARDEKRGLQALEKLKSFGYSDDLVVFHQLDVGSQSSVDSLAVFIKEKFGKLDILINNAGVSGVVVENADSYMEIIQNHVKENNSQSEEKKEILEKAEESDSDTYEWAEQCLETNYFGLKRVTEALLPLLLLSDSPRIVNVSSPMGMLKNLSNKWAIGVLSNVEELTVEKVDEIVSEYLKDRKEGSFVAKGWPGYFSAYKLSKAVVNGYTRILAKEYPQIITNAVDPGFVATELTHNLGHFTPEQGAECPVKLALLPKEGPSGLFWERHEVGSY